MPGSTNMHQFPLKTENTWHRELIWLTDTWLNYVAFLYAARRNTLIIWGFVLSIYLLFLFSPEPIERHVIYIGMRVMLVVIICLSAYNVAWPDIEADTYWHWSHRCHNIISISCRPTGRHILPWEHAWEPALGGNQSRYTQRPWQLCT